MTVRAATAGFIWGSPQAHLESLWGEHGTGALSAVSAAGRARGRYGASRSWCRTTTPPPVHDHPQPLQNLASPLPMTPQVRGHAFGSGGAVDPYLVAGCEVLPPATGVVVSLLPHSRTGLGLASKLVRHLQALLQPVEVVHLGPIFHLTPRCLQTSPNTAWQGNSTTPQH
ncbi:hypothetical protein AAFF_G00255780 [Aldrovandia affinis]|uniref:Uncharacterized protein n=1 Tax=Aldrovandia affinis TaxID=143900 RepID=A0AAD7RCI5_9TELE|nr:hypothetical protein AAFF_G00255780 [Aldrovandia affinis]